MFDLQIYYELKGEDNRFRQLTPLFPLLFTPYNQKKEKSQPPPYTYLRGLQAWETIKSTFTWDPKWTQSRRFEISTHFEKSFRLHCNLTTAKLKPFSKIVPFAWQFHCDTFPNDSKILLHMRKL